MIIIPNRLPDVIQIAFKVRGDFIMGEGYIYRHQFTYDYYKAEVESLLKVTMDGLPRVNLLYTYKIYLK